MVSWVILGSIRGWRVIEGVVEEGISLPMC